MTSDARETNASFPHDGTEKWKILKNISDQKIQHGYEEVLAKETLRSATTWRRNPLLIKRHVVKKNTGVEVSLHEY